MDCFTIFLPSTRTTTVSKYGTNEYDNSVVKKKNTHTPARTHTERERERESF